MLHRPLPLRHLLMVASVGALTLPVLSATGEEPTFKLAATVRDFKSGANPGGHPDFDTNNAANRSGLIFGLVAPMLGADGVPVYNPVRPSNPEGNDGMTTQANFDQWYRDAPAVNRTVPIEINFGPHPDDPGLMTTAGFNPDLYDDGLFLPIPDLGWGNEAIHEDGRNNWNFTTQFNAEFLYRPTTAFTFVGDDDVWAYVNQHLVIDLGGTHNAKRANFLMLNGKVFLDRTAFPVGGDVQEITPAYLSALETFWARLGMTDPLPLTTGRNTFIDLNLPIGSDVRGVFNIDSVQIYTTGAPPANVRLDFYDDTTQLVPGAGNGGRYSGGNGKPIRGVWVQADDGTEQYVAPGGMQAGACVLDFFHAERHFHGSAFRIETTLLGDGVGGEFDFVGFD